MSGDEHVRAAAGRLIVRERLNLLRLFHPRVATALGRYFAETVERGGMPSDEARQALADLLAPHGLADPQGQGRHPPLKQVPDVGNFQTDAVGEEYRDGDLRALGIGLDVFRSEVARRNRESPRPVTPAEVAVALVRDQAANASPRALTAPLRRLARRLHPLARVRAW